MAGKLIIRRVGNLFPHLCLACVLVLVALIIWLSTVGLPSSAERFIERQAADAGLPITLKDIKFIPRKGLAIKIEQISLKVAQPNEKPAELYLRKVELGFNLFQLLTGDCIPSKLRLKGGCIRIPDKCGKEDEITISNIDSYCIFFPRMSGFDALVKANLHGIDFDNKVHILFPQQATKTESSTAPKIEQIPLIDKLSSLLAENKPYIQELHKELERQKWGSANRPKINFLLSREDELKARLTAWIPEYEIDSVQVKDAELDAIFDHKTITINKLNLKTYNPDTRISLQGAYDLSSREIEFHTSSNAPLINMMKKYIVKDSSSILEKINSLDGKTPEIKLNGSAKFTEEHALDNITLRGSIEHEDVMFGQTLVEKLNMSFFMKNGCISINNFIINTQDGHLNITGKAADGQGTLEADFQLLPETILQLARDFSNTPGLSIPDDIQLTDKLSGHLSCKARIPVFEPGTTRIEDFIPVLEEAEIKVSTSLAEGKGVRLRNAALTLKFTGLEYLDKIEAPTLQNCELTITAGELTGEGVNAEKAVCSLTLGNILFDIKNKQPFFTACEARLVAEKLQGKGYELEKADLSLNCQGICHDATEQSVHFDHYSMRFLAGRVQAPQFQLVNTDIDLSMQGLLIQKDKLSIGKAGLSLLIDNAASPYLKMETSKLACNASLHDLQAATDFSDIKMGASDVSLTADAYADARSTITGIALNASLPEWKKDPNDWSRLIQDFSAQASLQKLVHNNGTSASAIQLSIQNQESDTTRIILTGLCGEDELNLSATARIQHGSLLLINDLTANLPLSSLVPFFGGEPFAEIKMPKKLSLRGDALINTKAKRISKAHYDIHIPELKRVCNNIAAYRGREIPLGVQIKGDFSTQNSGTMSYAANVEIHHEKESLKVRVSGNPLKDCHITGSNTIPVDIVNALLDNASAHWVMRDFRCTPGKTRNIITNIDATIRYDNGVNALVNCDAELHNLEFILGALRDEYDAQGKETGKEYLRTDLSPNPYTLVRKGTCHVEVIVQVNCKDAKGKPRPERIRINLTKPHLVYDNTPWLKRMGFPKGRETSIISGEAVRFNIEDLTITLHNLKGKCYPAYSIGMYYAPIQHFMEDIILKEPVTIETDYCCFPLSSRCKVPMKGLIKAVGTTGTGFRFLGTTIPFTNFSGFINISDKDVYLDRMNAQCWGGVMNANLRIGFSGKHTTLDGLVKADNLNLKDIVASYGGKFTPALCSGAIRFQAAKPELDELRAYGELKLKDGDLMQIGLFRPIAEFITDLPSYLVKLKDKISTKAKAEKVQFEASTSRPVMDFVQNYTYKVPFANHFLRYGIDSAHAEFDIQNGHLTTRKMKAEGYNLEIESELDINLHELTLQGDMWPQIASIPTILTAPITLLSDFLIDIKVHGDVLSPQWKVVFMKMNEPTPAAESKKSAAPKN